MILTMNLRTHLHAFLLTTLLTLALAGNPPHSPRPTCSEVTFTITTSSNNSVFASPPSPTNDTALWDFLASGFRGNLPTIIGTRPISGTFNISGTYCLPHHHRPRSPPTLQILLHGITYSKSVWAGLGFGPHYNWHHAANARGYATLAIDRLGNGLSSRPDPINIAQPQLELALLNEIVKSAQGIPSPSTSIPNSPFNSSRHIYPNVILVGHSFGSYLAPALSTFYPATRISALILTGFSTEFNISFLADQSWAPASVADPVRFGNLSNLRGYFAQRKASEREEGWYAGAYDKSIPKVDFATRDTVAVGGFGGLEVLSNPAVNWRGPVMVVTGELDSGLCAGGYEKCREVLERSRSFFPGVKEGEGGYEYLVVRDTGHDLMLHYSAADTVRRVHDWLDGSV